MQAISKTIPPHRELVFPWPYRREQLYVHWRKILRGAGVPVTARNGIQKLRRTSASHLEAVQPGSAMRHLGHATRGLAEKHYIDPRVAVARPPLPPELPVRLAN